MLKHTEFLTAMVGKWGLGVSGTTGGTQHALKPRIRARLMMMS